MTDIVTRLRSSGADGDAVYMWNLCTEAADEIERLRADAERYVWIFNNCEVTYYKHDLPFATEADLDAAMKDGK